MAYSSLKSKSPGPKYLLPPTIGPEGKDPKFKKSPAYYFGRTLPKNYKMSGPGPKYNTTGQGPKGPSFSPGFQFGTKTEVKHTTNIIPSPQSYGPHLCPDTVHNRPPSWEFGSVTQKVMRMSGPGPKYSIPPVVAHLPPDLPAAPAYTILGRDAIKNTKSCSPGPGKYASVRPDVYTTRSPTPFILGKLNQPTIYSQTIPGPKYSSNYNWKTDPPSYSFGVKHSDVQIIAYMPQDCEPFAGI